MTKDHDLISRQAAIEALDKDIMGGLNYESILRGLPSAQPEYKPVTAEDFAKTMSRNTLYSFMRWNNEALELMEGHGFVICKKTI